MVVLVATETVLLVLLGVLVVGLLRSHAEILRRLELPAHERGGTPELPDPPAGRGRRAAIDVVGATPSGDAIKVALGPGAPPTLLAFLTSGCGSCAELLAAIGRDGPPRLPGDGRLVVVTKDPAVERPARLRALEADVRVVMSSAAWEAYGVPGSPYFAWVDGGGRLVGEGSATTWERVLGLLADAEEERADPGGRIEDDLDGAGIRAGDPSLYPAGPAPEEAERR